jgi:hypothetical protein
MKANKGKVRIQAHLVNWGSKNFSFTTSQLVVPSQVKYSKQANEQKRLKKRTNGEISFYFTNRT